MTDEAVRNALTSAIRNAVHLGRQSVGRMSKAQPHEIEALAQKYAESLVLPVVEARVEQALEDGFASAREAARGVGAA